MDGLVQILSYKFSLIILLRDEVMTRKDEKKRFIAGFAHK